MHVMSFTVHGHESMAELAECYGCQTNVAEVVMPTPEPNLDRASMPE